MSKNGSATINSAILNPKSIGQETYGFKYGSDPRSEAIGALAAFDNSVANLNAAQRGQVGGVPLNTMTVPQFPEFNPTGPNGPTNTSADLNSSNITVLRQSAWDKSAFTKTPPPVVGGSRRLRRKKHNYTKVKKLGRRKKTKGRKTKGRKTKGRKTKGRKTKGRKTKGRKTKGRKTKGRKMN
jgi:hypothetical protein